MATEERTTLTDDDISTVSVRQAARPSLQRGVIARTQDADQGDADADGSDADSSDRGDSGDRTDATDRGDATDRSDRGDRA